MTKELVGPWVRRFLIEYMIGERNYSSNTQHSYRDMFRLFLPFAAKRSRCKIDQLPLARIQPRLIREFTQNLEQVRHCSPSTINQRLTALRAWAGFVGTNSPEHLEWSRQIQTVHFKKHAPGLMNYLDKEEMKALLAAPDQQDGQGFRDYAILLFLYNTGARASEASHLKIGDLDLVASVATLHGKGRRVRQCPLWKLTATTLGRLVGNRMASLKMKAEALACCEAPLLLLGKKSNDQKGLMGFLARI
jgi:integrase/recombinase XerD